MCDLLQCALTAAAAVCLNDGDYRSYTFIAALAVQAGAAFTELGYEQMAARHPGSAPLTSAAVRARIARLVDAGLLRRERAGRTCWRTWVTPLEGAIRESTQPAVGATAGSTQGTGAEVWVQSEIAPISVVASVPAMPGGTHVEAASIDMGVDVMPGHTHTQKRSVSAMPQHTQLAVTATADSTQRPDQSHEPPDRMITDSLTLASSSNQSSAAALEQHLRRLAPKPMNPAGIAECLRAPELTSAWLVWVQDPANGVTSPAAYLRAQVRRGQFPPQPGREEGA